MRWIAVVAPVVAACVGVYVVILQWRAIRRIDFLLTLISSRTKPPEGGPPP